MAGDAKSADGDAGVAQRGAGLLAVRLAEFDAVPARAAELIADLVEPATATALEKLGEGEHSLAIATGWLRPKLEPAAAGADLAG